MDNDCIMKPCILLYYNVQFTMYYVNYNAQCAMYITMHTVQCTLQCTMYNVPPVCTYIYAAIRTWIDKIK